MPGSLLPSRILPLRLPLIPTYNILMKVFIVYCHPSEDSFTRHARDSFIKGVVDSGNECVISDLYKMNFKTDMSETEYLRDANYCDSPDIAEDVLLEQEKINSSDAIAFIYPVFWTEAPAKLVGWFDRVWSYGFAYGERKMKTLQKALVLCSAGNTRERLEQFGLVDAMKKVMFGDRLFGRSRATEFVVFDGTSRENPMRKNNWEKNLLTAYEKGKTLFAENAVVNETVNSSAKNLDYEITDTLTPEEYMEMRRLVGWSEFPLEQAAAGLCGTSHIACFRKNGKVIALNRVIWDGGYVVYIADVIVRPEFQGQGLGRALVEDALSFIKGVLKPGYKVMVSLSAAKGKEEFYKKFGFFTRPNEEHGCGMCRWLEAEKQSEEA